MKPPRFIMIDGKGNETDEHRRMTGVSMHKEDRPVYPRDRFDISWDENGKVRQ